jgi:hypothetical protein
MAKPQWAQLCELAFLDDCDRLCMIGIMTRFPVPFLPIAMRQLMIVARIADVRPGESFGVGVSLTMPSGLSIAGHQTDGFEVGIAAEYVLITLRDIPVAEEGLHRLLVSIGDGDPAVLDIPVQLVAKPPQPGHHPNDTRPRPFGRPPWLSPPDVN